MKNLVSKIKYLWILAIVIFVSLYFYKHFDSILKIIKFIPFLNLFGAFVSLFLAKVLLSYISLISARYFDFAISFSKMFVIYNVTQMAKYIPGSIWQFVGKAGAYAKEGMHTAIIKKSILVEMLWVLSSAFILGSVLVLSGTILDIQFVIEKIHKYILIYGIIFFIALAGIFFYLKKTISFLGIIIKNFPLNIKMSFSLVSVWFLLGMGFFIILLPYVENASLGLYVNVVGLYALAYAIGFLIPFAPAGIGVREAILVAGLTSFLSSDQAIVLASLNRIIYIILEVFIVVVLMQLKLYNYQKNRRKS